LRAAGTLALQKASAVRPPDVPAPLSHLEILVVDDERDALELLALMLTTRGARARTVSSAAEALEALRQRTPDVLLADIGLPQEDGYSLIRRWRAEERERQLPRVAAIAVTAYARPQDREQAITAGFDWHLAKPVDPDDLIQAVANLTAVESREPELQPRIACSKENS
jgi:CheY-like chemotaxis protein